jgi:HAD superfamily hydrolase (TIGR01509 family)
MHRFEAVILDIDGTLVYSNDEHARAFLDAAGELGLDDPGFDVVRRLIGKGGDKLIPEAFGMEAESDVGRKLEERKGEIFRDRYLDDLRPTPGARALLQRLAADGIRRVVATSAGEDDLELLLGRAGVADLIDDATTASDVDDSKPDPDVVRAALKLARRPADRVAMIGDTPYDVEAARRAGVRIYAVRCGGWNEDGLKGAAAVYDDPEDVLRAYTEGRPSAAPSGGAG